MSDTPASQRQVFGQLFKLSLPIIGLNVLGVLTLAVDTAMCGRLENADEALTALGFATQLVFLLMVGMIGLAVGTVALVARAHGAREDDRVNHIFHQASQLTLMLGIGVGIIGLTIPELLCQAIGAEPHIAEIGADYLRPVLGGTVFYYMSLLWAAILRGLGNTRLPFFVALVFNGINVVLNYGLILGNLGMPALGVMGAGIATVVSQGTGVILLFLLLRRGVIPSLRPRIRLVPIDKKLAGVLIAIGTPAALDMVILNASFLSIVGMLSVIDQVAVAAHGIGIRIQSLAFVPGMSISQATGAMVGNALGAGSAEGARRVVRSSIVLCTAIMSALAVALIVAVEPIIAIFDVDPTSTMGLYSIDWVLILGWGMPIVGVFISFGGMLRGAGETRTSLKINLWGTLAVQIPLSYLLGFPLGMGAFGIWLAFPIAFALKTVMALWIYKSGKWIKLGTKPRG